MKKELSIGPLRYARIEKHQQDRRRRAGTRSRALAMAAAATMLMIGAAARAANSYWDGDSTAPADGGSGVWDTTSADWSPTNGGSNFAAFNPSDDAFFDGTAGFVQVGTDASPAIAANSLNFTSDGYRLINPSAGASTLTLASGLVDTGSGTIDLQPGLAGGAGLIKNGIGTLIFDGANTYTGNTVINAGTLALGNTAVADIPDSSQVQIASGATLDLGRNGGWYNDTVGSIDGAGNIHFGTATPGYGTLTGSVLAAGGDGSFTNFTGVMSGAGGQFVKTGIGQITLSGANTISGSYTVNNGTLAVTGGNAIDDSTPVFVNPSFDSTGAVIGAGTFQLGADETIGGLGGGFASGNPQVVDLGGFTLTINNTRNIAYNSVITDTGNLIKTGPGIEQLANANSNFLGSITIKQGTLLASRDTSLGNSSNTVTLDGGALSNFRGTGVSYSANRNFVLTPNGGTVQVITSTTSNVTSTIAGTVTGGSTGTLFKAGPGQLALNGANNFAGGLTMLEGAVSTNQTSGAPLGSGTIDLRTGFVILNPTSAGTASLALAGGPGAVMKFGPGSQLQANRGSNTVFNVNIGGTGAAATTLQRQGAGTFVIIPSGYANLGAPSGTGEVIKVAGGVPSKNGMVAPYFVSWTNTGASAPEFLDYGANGFQPATYSPLTDINAGDNTTVFRATDTSTNLLSADRTVYALNMADVRPNTAATVDPNGHTLTIGDGTGPAGMIMAIASQIGTAASPAGSALVFNGNEIVIHSQNTAAGNIWVPMSATNPSAGLTKFGYGSLTLNAPATYGGATTIGAGTLSLKVNNALPSTTDVVLDGFAGTSTTLALNNSTQSIHSLAGLNSTAKVDLGTGALTVNQDTNTTYAGLITATNNGPGAQGQLIKQGSGTLTLSNRYVNPGTNAYKLHISGGTVAASSLYSLPAGAQGSTPTFIPDAITLDNGGTLRWDGINTIESNLVSFDMTDQGAGLTLGSGGGTIDVSDPNEILILQDIGVQSTDPTSPSFNWRNAIVHDITGSGDLTKTGPGILRLYANAAALDSTGTTPQPIANSYTGKTHVLGGTLQIPDDGALGQAPASLVPDQLTIDNNAILQSNGPGNIAATRGITIGAGGGQLYATGSFNVNSPLAGTGTLTKTGAGSLALNAAGSGFSGNVVLTNGSTFFNASGSAGSGAIQINPQFPVVFGSNANSSVTLNNAVSLGAGAQVTAEVDGTSQLELAGAVSGSNDLYKTGTGTLKLSGSPSYTGGTIVSNGTLELDASMTASSAVMVQETGKLVLAASGGNRVIKTVTLAVAPGGSIDLTDNKLIITQPSSVGTWNGSAYTGASGLVASARNGGAWNGSGITSSLASTPSSPGGSNLYSIGVAKAGDIKQISDSATATFAGQTVHGSDTLVMYTYGGDANLDGKINIDDYGRIDGNVGQSGSVFGWYNGDFNYDGKINIDDYGIIDGNIGLQGAPIPTTAGAAALDSAAGAEGVSAVPEPASFGLIALAGAGLLSRRRRHD